jgi:hypothetical protein
MRAVRFRVVLVTAVMLLLVAVPAASEPLTRQPGPYTVTVGDDDRMNPLSGKPISIHATVNGTTSSGREFTLRGLNLGDVVSLEAEPGAFKDTDGTCWGLHGLVDQHAGHRPGKAALHVALDLVDGPGPGRHRGLDLPALRPEPGLVVAAPGMLVAAGRSATPRLVRAASGLGAGVEHGLVDLAPGHAGGPGHLGHGPLGIRARRDQAGDLAGQVP